MITACPICNGSLQSTKVYHVYTDIEKLSVVRHPKGGAWFEADDDDSHLRESEPTFAEEFFYCENDHTERQMIAFVGIDTIKE